MYVQWDIKTAWLYEVYDLDGDGKNLEKDFRKLAYTYIEILT